VERQADVSGSAFFAGSELKFIGRESKRRPGSICYGNPLGSVDREGAGGNAARQ
jgi:hypothetical protein